MTRSVNLVICSPEMGTDALVNYVIAPLGVMTSLSMIGLLAFVFPVLSITVDHPMCSITSISEINLYTIPIHLKLIEDLSTVANVAVGKVAPSSSI